MSMSDTIHLVLSHYWFDQIVAGKKRVEYRDLGTYWADRVWKDRQEKKFVVFQRAYAKDAQRLKFRIDKIDVGPCPYPGWDEKYFRIHFTKQAIGG